MSDWQPIETAPRDGTEVIGCCVYSWGINNDKISEDGPWTMRFERGAAFFGVAQMFRARQGRRREMNRPENEQDRVVEFMREKSKPKGDSDLLERINERLEMLPLPSYGLIVTTKDFALLTEAAEKIKEVSWMSKAIEEIEKWCDEYIAGKGQNSYYNEVGYQFKQIINRHRGG
jgi:hypothetical protein